MGDKIIIGKNGNEHGIWVARPGQYVEDGGPYLMSSVADMLKIHAQGTFSSTAVNQSLGLWRHNIVVPFPELPFIPLAFMGFSSPGAEPFQFPPDLLPGVTSGGTSLRSLIPAMGIAHNKLSMAGWTQQREGKFHYTVFLTKIRDKF